MSETVLALKHLTNEWATLVMGRAASTSNLPSKELEQRIKSLDETKMKGKGVKIPIEEGYELTKMFSSETLSMMLESLNAELAVFHKSLHFPLVFSELVKMTHGIFKLNLNVINPKEKQKSLHTDALVNEEILTDLQKLQCSVLKFLS